jgi:hypothetical protein
MSEVTKIGGLGPVANISSKVMEDLVAQSNCWTTIWQSVNPVGKTGDSQRRHGDLVEL